jgi:hypothetical protein
MRHQKPKANLQSERPTDEDIADEEKSFGKRPLQAALPKDHRG